jgi:hypothetical protein
VFIPPYPPRFQCLKSSVLVILHKKLSLYDDPNLLICEHIRLALCFQTLICFVLPSQ